MFSKLKQFKDLRNQAKNIKNTMAQENATGEADWGKVKVHINGNQEITGVEIDPQLLNNDNKNHLETAIKDATNDAIKNVQKLLAEKIRQGDLSLPDLNNFKF